jgi:hypothetical protein
MDEKVKFYTQAFSLLMICSVLLVIFKQCDSFVNVNNMVDSQGYQINSPASVPMATTQAPPAYVAAAAGTGYTPASSYAGLPTSFIATQAQQAAQMAQARQSVAEASQVPQTTQIQTTQVSAPPPEDSGTSTAVYVVGAVVLVGAIGGGVYFLMLNKAF